SFSRRRFHFRAEVYTLRQKFSFSGRRFHFRAEVYTLRQKFSFSRRRFHFRAEVLLPAESIKIPLPIKEGGLFIPIFPLIYAILQEVLVTAGKKVILREHECYFPGQPASHPILVSCEQAQDAFWIPLRLPTPCKYGRVHAV